MPSTAAMMLLLGSVAAPDVPLFVREAADVARPGAVVRGGVPFPRGALADGDHLVLTATDGTHPMCTTRPLAHWYDGSVKWLLVDTRVDVLAGGRVDLRLAPGDSPPGGPPAVKVEDAARTITLDTGAARFEFSKAAFGVPARAWVGNASVTDHPGTFTCDVEHTPPGPPTEENWLRDAAGGERERFEALPAGDYRCEVEHADALRAVIKLSGWLVNPAGRRLIWYAVRAYATAGRPELRLVVSTVYAGKPKEDFIRTLALTFPRLFPAAGATTWALGGETRHGGNLGPPVDLVAIGPDKFHHLVPYTADKSVRYTVSQGGKELAAGAEPAGWARIADGAGSLTFGLRNFATMHPKQLRLTQRELTCYLWPEAGGKVLDLRRRSDEVDNVYHYDLSLWEYGGEGVGLTHEMTLWYGRPDEDPSARLTADLQDPLRLECSPQLYADSGTFGPLEPADPQRYPRLEGYLDVGVEWIRHNQRAFRWDGMIDYGDTMFLGYEAPTHYGYQAPQSWGSRGYVGWLCNDGTLTHSLFLHALRTGDPEFFRTAEAMCRHVTEVDTCHYCAEHPRYVGGGHRHDQQHWGNGVRGYGTATHGAIDYYCLTGDERTLDVIGEYTQLHLDGDGGENEDRIGGLIRAWELNGDPKLKQAADSLVAAELNVPADQPWPFVTGQHFRFVSNTSASLLAYLWCAPPADTEKLWAAVLKAMDFRERTFKSTWEDAGYLAITLNSLALWKTGEARYADMLCGLLQRSAVPRTVEAAPDLLPGLRAASFETMVATARQWGVNNVYIFNIHQLCSFPYAEAALRKAGRDEAAVWAFQRIGNQAEPFEEVLRPQSIGHEFGFLYQGSLAHGSPSDVGGGRSELVLLEDGKPLGPAHSSHADIRKLGEGRWSHWGSNMVWFSASDNSDPRTNGREYKVVYKPAP
ncbi:MAG: hypothetical protein HYU66_28335 [Armatimonadetes bacterium]|nr:hypothetical protein [Armatimonadota bacterium]